jgi:hypothetical protein
MEDSKRLIFTERFLLHLPIHLDEMADEYRRKLQGLGWSEKEFLEARQTVGSKFDPQIVRSPDDIRTLIAKVNPICRLMQSNGNVALTFAFGFILGTESLISFDELKGVPHAVQKKERNGFKVNVVSLPEFKPTNEITLIVNSFDEAITVFPGRYAPPFPRNGMKEEEKANCTTFWNSHAFITKGLVI